MLAALDRLEQKRVVGVLGDLQERRHRRQHVGDELFVDGDKRPSLRQLFEFFERCDFHVRCMRRVIASAITPGSGRLARPPLELSLGLRNEHRQPVDRQRPGRPCIAEQGRRSRPIGQVIDERSRHELGRQR